MMLSAVKELKTSSKDLYEFLEFFLQKDMATFAKNLS